MKERFNSIGEQKRPLTLTLDPSEPVNVELTRAKAFQTFVQQHRAEREQAIVGASVGAAGSPPIPR